MTQLSIIIPHKNIPDLLSRGLESIPESDDIEVIIVDDNSDCIDRATFPGVHRANTKVYFSTKSLTAGGARNVGLEMATGKWIMFADSDDFYHSNFLSSISHYFDSDFDLIYFGMDSVHSDTLKPSNRGAGIFNILERASLGDGEAAEVIRYKFLYPSGKLIRHELISRHNIRFDEVPASNDTMFGVKVAANAKK